MGKRKAFSVEKIIQILKENEAGIPVTHLARQHRVAAGTIHQKQNSDQKLADQLRRERKD